MNTFKTIFLLATLVFTLSACSEDEPTVYEYEDIRPELIENCGWYIHEEIAGTKEMEFSFGKGYNLLFEFRCITVGDNPALYNGFRYYYELKDGVMYFGEYPIIEIRMIKGTLSYKDNTDFWQCKIEIRGTRGTYVVPIYQNARWQEN